MKNLIKIGDLTFELYWKTAMDGKRWCRVRVTDERRGTKYPYNYYFKTIKAARIHILACAA